MARIWTIFEPNRLRRREICSDIFLNERASEQTNQTIETNKKCSFFSLKKTVSVLDVFSNEPSTIIEGRGDYW